MKTRILAFGILAAASLLAIGSLAGVGVAGEASANSCVYATDPLTGYDIGCRSTYCAPGDEVQCYVTG